MSDFRKRVAEPFLIPIGAFVFIGILVFGFSRLLLVVTKDGSVVLGVVLSAAILFGAGALSKSGVLKGSQRLALPAFAVLLTAAGIIAGVSMNTREVEGHVEIGAEITAQGIAFDKAQLTLPADEATAILFHNKDAGVLHNVAIFGDPRFTQSVFPSELFQGVADRTYVLEEGLAQGVYFFRCDAHPTQMQGQLLVGGATAPPLTSPTASPTATGPAPAPTSPQPSPSPS